MRDIDPNIDKLALRKNKANIVDFDIAVSQKALLQNALQKLGLNIVTLPSDGYPDSTFVEDTAVIIDGVALVTNPGALSRRGEVDRVRQYLSSLQAITLLHWSSADSFLDGGDVLFTGSKISSIEN